MIDFLTGLALVGAAAAVVAAALAAAKCRIENGKWRIADSSLILHYPFYIFNSFRRGDFRNFPGQTIRLDLGGGIEGRLMVK